MALDFGAAYQAGGFGSGFLQGFGAMQEQQRLNIEKQRAAREQDLYNRGKAQEELRGAFQQVASLKDSMDNGETVDPETFKSSIDNVNTTLTKHGLPAINDFYDPKFAQYIQTGNKILSGQISPRDPEALQALQYRYSDQLNQGIGEKTVHDMQGTRGVIPKGAVVDHKQLVDMVPGQNGTFHPELGITMSWTDKDGNLQHDTIKDPMTYERSVHPEDSLLKPISAHDLADQHISDTAFYKAFNDPSIKAGMIGKYLALGGKAEDLDNPIKKTAVQEWYYMADPKTGEETNNPNGIAMVGKAILDQHGNIIKKYPGVPTAQLGYRFPGGTYGLGASSGQAYAAKYRYGFGNNQKKEEFMLNWLTQTAKQNNPNMSEGAARAAAWDAYTSGQYKDNIAAIAQAAAKEKSVWGTDNVSAIADQLQRERSTRATSPIGPQNPQQPANQPQTQPQAQGGAAPEGTVIDGPNGPMVKKGGQWVKY